MFKQKLTKTCIHLIVFSVLLLCFLYIILPSDTGLPTAYVAYSDSKSFACGTAFGGANFYREDIGETSKSPSLFMLDNFVEPMICNVYVRYTLSDMSLFLQKRNRLYQDTPEALYIVRFPIEDVVMFGDSLKFEDGETVEWTQDGNYYSMSPVDNNVYIARSYWDEGWIENIWIVINKFSEISLVND